ncbi:hypothetical protein WNY37_13695 [Henriciella sp. AS95]|uniref:AAA family ATPase n=1 Tax=Henriciella sp. AS95 TaxID=3135782 RepID=UPI00316C69E3
MAGSTKPSLPARLHIFAPQWGANISEAAQKLGSVSPTIHTDAVAAYEAAASDHNAVIVLENDGSYDLVELLTRVSGTNPSMPGIVVGKNIPVLAVKHIITLGRWDMLDAPVEHEPLRDALQQICRREDANSDSAAGKCWTVTGSVGGSGATLVAVELAYQFSRREKNNKVCLVDLNFFDGACASYLNCPSNLNQAALTQPADRIDDALLQAFITRHKNGIHLLSAGRSSRMWNSIKPESILKVLEVACNSYDMVIIDMPRWPTPWSNAVVMGSDEVLILSELTVPALHAARHRAEELEDGTDGLANPLIILNRMTKKVFGNAVTVSQAEEAIGRHVFASVSSDWEAALSSVNFGQAVGQTKPGNKISKDVAEIITRLEEGAETVAEPNKARKRA